MENLSNSDSKASRRAELLAALAELDLETHLEDKPSILPIDSIISSPALQPQFQEGQQVAFIHSRIDVVPAIVTKLHPRGICDLEILVPKQTLSIKWKASKTAFDRVETNDLATEPRLRARPSDPRLIYRQQMVALSEPQRGTEGVLQTHMDIYSPMQDSQGNNVLLDVPRFHDFHTSLVGTFFDPSIYHFKVFCYRAKKDVDGIVLPEEQLLFPKKAPFYYDNFHKAFARFFKEYYKGRSRYASKWDIVQIQPLLAS